MAKYRYVFENYFQERVINERIRINNKNKTTENDTWRFRLGDQIQGNKTLGSGNNRSKIFKHEFQVLGLDGNDNGNDNGNGNGNDNDNVTIQDIKSRYRELVHKYHPDHNHGDHKSSEKFIEIHRAYKTLIMYYSNR